MGDKEDKISINLCRGDMACSARMKQVFEGAIACHIETGALSLTFDEKRNWLTLTSDDLDALTDAEEKAQRMLGFVD